MIDLQRRHKERIKRLFKDRFTLEEIYIAYKELIPYDQLRHIIKNVLFHSNARVNLLSLD